MKGFIELKVLHKVQGYYDNSDFMSTRVEEEVELVNINDIARVSMGGYVTFKTPYNNGERSTSTNNTLEEIKQLIKQAQ